MEKKEFNDVQLHLFLLYALRYAVGKKSDVINEYIQALCLNWDAVPSFTKEAMITGLGQQIEYHFNLLNHRKTNGENLEDATNLGSPIDADSWIRFHRFMVRQENGDT